MAKKRKASGRQAETFNGPNADVGSSKKRIRDFEDVADSDDEFHLNRDKVLLDEAPDAKRRRKWEEQEEFLQASDEEVLGQSDEESEDEAANARFDQDEVASASGGSNAEGEDEEDEFRWGTGKDDIYGADEIETEEQALEEEAEALRLQKKQLESMTAADYGFDETEWQGSAVDKDATEKDHQSVVTEVLPQLQIAEGMTPVERLKLLKSRYPEFEPLSKELLAVQEEQTSLVEELDIAENGFDRDDLPNLKTKVRAASAYLGALVMYFTLLSSPAASGGLRTVAMSASTLRDHPIMDTLMKCKELWSRARSLPEDVLSVRSSSRGAEPDKNGSFTIANAEERISTPRTKRKSRAQRHAEAAQVAAEARKAERMQRTEADLANLDSLVALSTKRKPQNQNRVSTLGTDAASDGEEEAPLTAQEAAEKARRKKSLRFYTSQIAQKANKRGAASRNAGGDDDIPHRERLRDRQARLNAEAEKRGRKATDGRAELGGESDEEDARQIQDVKASAADEDYYDLVAARTARKKADKAAFVDAKKQAAFEGGRVVPEETVGADGKRKITYAIEKNKGLTPHRKKEVRNPRVKRRKKYDASKKKLASIKPLYKGGEARGGYGGELTGIKKGLVKSTKL